MRRARNPKSKTGCSRCKEQRLKCDEKKPACDRCISKNFNCPGYVRSYTWSTKYEVFKPKAAPTGHTPTTLLSRASEDAESQVQRVDLLMAPTPQATTPTEDVSFMDPFLINADYSLDEIFEFGMEEFNHSGNTLTSISSDNVNSGALNGISGMTSFWELQNSPSRTSDQDESAPASTMAIQKPPLHRGGQAFATQLAAPIRDNSTVLIEYYFKEVANVFSCYDSHLNPFRTTVSRSWASSPPIYYALQSMAASSLSDDLPQFHAVASEMRRQASAAIEREIGSKKIAPLLALIMIGQTASWHISSNLGLEEFNSACVILDTLLSNRDNDNQLHTDARNLRFFQEALVYWRMLLSYVTDDTFQFRQLSLSYGSQTPEPTYPHPWTGVARDAQLLVFEVGKLIRSELKRLCKRSFSTQASIFQAQQALRQAELLEQQLLLVNPPSEFSIANPGDDYTPVDHFLKIAEAYRYTGLLQLYRVFPDLLARHSNTLTLDANIMCFDGIIDGNDLSLPEARDACLTRLALHILGILRLLPVESRTRCVQPFLFVSVSSELRLLPRPPAHRISLAPSRTSEMEISSEVIDIIVARKFVTNRLTYLKHVLPSKPVITMLKLVHETWERMDNGAADVYWMDVMIEKGYETMMG